MAVYAPEILRFECSYGPCKHVQDVTFITQAVENGETTFCPKCGLFTFEYKVFSDEDLQRFSNIKLPRHQHCEAVISARVVEESE